MTLPFLDPELGHIQKKISDGHRLDVEDGLKLYNSPDLLGVARLAHGVRTQRHGKQAYYIINQHLNYTNICKNQCRFCAYARKEKEPGGFTLTFGQIEENLMARRHEPIREIHIVGGLNPALSLDYYLKLVKTVHKIRPDAMIKAFTPVEIDCLAHEAKTTIEDIISQLKQAGLGMLPGGGAEVMSERVRQELFPKKISGERWLEIMAAVHDAGIRSNATMLYGHIETLEERLTHLIKLRTLQDKTDGFVAFIPLSFHSKNTKLAYLPPTTAYDDLKTIAIARLLLDNIPHIKAYWVMIGEKLAQIALSFGADDLDGTIVEEKISHMAGATSSKGLTRRQLVRLIEQAGFTAVERDSLYQPVISDVVI